MTSLDRLAERLRRLWTGAADRALMLPTLLAFDELYALGEKLRREPETGAILEQMVGRLARAYPGISALKGKRILDIACGSNTSRLPPTFFLKTLLGGMHVQGANRGFTALFEPWFCRLLLQWEAQPVGVDFGNLEDERFTHYNVDLGKPGALDFLPDHSFDGIQDSRLFGSPEFTAQFPRAEDRIAVAREIVRQEQRLLAPGGVIIHSDAAGLVS